MPRILGVDIPNDKPTHISLRYIYGIGPTLALRLCEQAKVNPQRRAKELSDDDISRLALILDIAIPRDFDPRVGDLEQVMLYNVDDLRAQAEQNRRQRQKGVDPALVIIERETAACYADLRHQRTAGAVLRQLGDSIDAMPTPTPHSTR